MLALYTVSDKYIDYLRNAVPIVYDSHKEDRVHERKYIGNSIAEVNARDLLH